MHKLHILLRLSSAPSGIPDDVMHTIERFDILLYDRTNTSMILAKTERNSSHKRTMCSSSHQPPKAALEEHMKMVAYQVVHNVESNTATNTRFASSKQLKLGQER